VQGEAYQESYGLDFVPIFLLGTDVLGFTGQALPLCCLSGRLVRGSGILGAGFGSTGLRRCRARVRGVLALHIAVLAAVTVTLVTMGGYGGRKGCSSGESGKYEAERDGARAMESPAWVEDEVSVGQLEL